MDLSSGTVAVVDDVQAFAFAGEGAYIAFRKYPPAAPAARGHRCGRNAAPPAGEAAVAGEDAAAAAEDGERDPTGTVIIVRNLATGVDTTFGNVTSFAWQDKGPTWR